MTRVIMTLNGSVNRTVVPSPGAALDADLPGQPFHGRAHRVHPDAPARQPGDFCRGRKSRLEDHVDDLLVAHGREDLFRDDIAFQRHLANPRDIDARSVVAHFHDDVLALPARDEAGWSRRMACDARRASTASSMP